VAIGLARSYEDAGGLLGSAKVGLAGWLLGHGVPLVASIGPVDLTPLLLTLLAAWRLNRAGVHVTRAIGARHSGSPGAAVLVAVSIGLWYAVLGALAAFVVDNPGMLVNIPRAGLCFAVIGFLSALVGSLRSTGAITVLARGVPTVLRHASRTGVVAGLLVLAAGAGFAGLSVAIGGGQAADMIGAYRTGVVGQAGISVVSVAYGANAAVWATSYLLGPGFLLGTGTTVRLTEVVVGPLPTVPLLAGLPEGPIGGLGVGLLAVPVLAGMVAGWMLARRLVRAQSNIQAHAQAKSKTRPTGRAAASPAVPAAGPSWALLLGAAALAGPVAGTVLGLLAWVSGGSLGGGRLAQIGPVPWQVAAVSAAMVSVAAVLGAAASRVFRGDRP
jgi:hypothetical protein